MQRQIKISPSILSADFARLGDEVCNIDIAGADYIHIDVMDGHFVPNITIGPIVIAALRPLTIKPLDVHLMITPTMPFIDPFIAAGADIITIHPESDANIHRTLQAIKAKGVKAGLAINPGTPISVVLPVLDLIDLILVMSVNPGFGGQNFITSSYKKLQDLRKIIDDSGYIIDLSVDGGINFTTAPLAIASGANVLVAGTAGFAGGHEQYHSNLTRLRSHQ